MTWYLCLIPDYESIKGLKDDCWFILCFMLIFSSPGSRDGYFEMSLDDSTEESVCSCSTSLTAPPAEEPGGHLGELCEEEVNVSKVLWCYCVQVNEEVEQKEACLVLTDRLLGLLCLPGHFTWTNQDAGKETLGLGANYFWMDCVLLVRNY